MFEDAIAPTQRVLEALAGFAPKLLLAILMLVIGAGLSALSRRAVVWLVRRTGLEAFGERLGVAKPLYALGYSSGIAELLGLFVWLGAWLTTIAAIAEMLGLPGIAEGIAVMIEFLPRVVSSAVVALCGFAGADLLRRVVQRISSQRSDVDSPEFFSRLAYYSALVVTAALTAEQLGFAVDLINALIQIVVATSMFGLALAFALSSRSTFENLLARHYASRLFTPGDYIRAEDVEGELLRFGVITALLETDEGEVTVPCAQLVQGPVLRTRERR